ncbi:hypothetical protein J6590_034035 [Homalodisca vitripennis]|nr:hypothetical protein J6590_034035 [Homalodisca vitripennis]
MDLWSGIILFDKSLQFVYVSVVDSLTRVGAETPDVVALKVNSLRKKCFLSEQQLPVSYHQLIYGTVHFTVTVEIVNINTLSY